MDTLYRKVEIKSELDLPKEDKRFYFHLRSDSGLRNCRPDSGTFRQIKKRIDWYLQPVEPREPIKGNPVYTLNCDKCEKPYSCADAFPEDQLCNMCFAEKYLKHHIEPKQSVKDKIKPFIANEEPVVSKWIKDDAKKQTAEEIKNKVANNNNFDSFERAIRYTFNRKLLQSEKEFIDKLFLEAIKEYAQYVQQERAIEVTDEEIEKMADNIELDKFISFWEAWIDGATWMRDKIKQNG